MTIAPELRVGNQWNLHNQGKTCARCGAYSAFRVKASAWPPAAAEQPEGFAVIVCDRCGGYSVIAAKPMPWPGFDEVRVALDHDPMQVVVTGFYPPASIEAEVAAAPAPIRATLREAALCKDVGAFHGGALVCRRAIQLIARDQKAPTGVLRDEIDGLEIPRTLKDAAHAIRLVGNEAGHPDLVEWESVTSEELGTLLDLSYQIVKYIYEMPQRTRALTERTRTRLMSP